MKEYKILIWLWWKKYLETGMGITRYLMYIIMLFGLASQDLKSTIILGVFYGILSFIVGWAWIKYRLAEQENEINNIINPFQREVRKKLNGQKLRDSSTSK